MLGTGIFAGAALKRLGEKFGDWVWKTFRQRWGRATKAGDTLISTITIIPPPDVRAEWRFPISVEIEIGPEIRHGLKSVISIEIGESGIRSHAELRERLGEEFDQFEKCLKTVFQAMRDGNVPLGITGACLERDYRLRAE